MCGVVVVWPTRSGACTSGCLCVRLLGKESGDMVVPKRSGACTLRWRGRAGCAKVFRCLQLRGAAQTGLQEILVLSSKTQRNLLSDSTSGIPPFPPSLAASSVPNA